MAKSLIDILVTKGAISLEEGSKFKQESKEKGISIDEVLYAAGLTESVVAEAKSDLTGYPVRSIQGVSVPFDILKDISEESARHYNMVPLGKEEGYLDVGVLYPEDSAVQDALKFISTRLNLPTRVFIITPTDFKNILAEYKSLAGEVTRALGEFEKEYGPTAEEEIKILGKSAQNIVEEAPVTKMIAVILRHAVEGKASDVHIEPLRDRVRVRFRVDGVLHTSLLLPADIRSALVTRIKVVANLKIDETRIPQDGRFNTEILGRNIDFRVSSFPTVFGEKVAIRVLDPEGGIKDFVSLGLDGRNLDLLEENIKRPYGLILITGPTGSGKSTTLYAILQKINSEGLNVISLEDPIEYYIPGVNQSQIRPEIGYEFSTGLRQILRQDPDIIMVGEIRDKETAALAIQAALTGHLVFSTIHTNNVIGVIPRLIDMGVDPFLIAPTLVLALGQRLARRLCEDSKKNLAITGKTKEVIMKEINDMPESAREELLAKMPKEIYQAKVSATCPKGTRGRIGVFEVLSMTSQLEKIILSGPSESKIQEEAKRQGLVTMRQDGIIKVLKGIIGLEELLEVT